MTINLPHDDEDGLRELSDEFLEPVDASIYGLFLDGGSEFVEER